jgi:hypothetical protein
MLPNPRHLKWMAVCQQLSGENMACLAYEMFALPTTARLKKQPSL